MEKSLVEKIPPSRQGRCRLSRINAFVLSSEWRRILVAALVGILGTLVLIPLALRAVESAPVSVNDSDWAAGETVGYYSVILEAMTFARHSARLSMYGAVSGLIIAVCWRSRVSIKWLAHPYPAKIGTAVLCSTIGSLAIYLWTASSLINIPLDPKAPGVSMRVAAVQGLCDSLAGPIAEELIWRGAFFLVLRKFVGAALACLCTSIGFVLAHGDHPLTAYLFFMSIWLVLCASAYGLVFSILAHSVMNSCAVLLYFELLFPDIGYLVNYLLSREHVGFWLIMGVGCIGFFIVLLRVVLSSPKICVRLRYYRMRGE